MNTRIIPFIVLLALFSACSNETFEPTLDSESVINVDELTGTQHDIMVNVLSTRFGGYRKGVRLTRSSDFSLTPYIDKGDTLLYIAQYANGWEIYSAHQSTKMVLFSSPSGRFNLYDPQMPPALKSMIRSAAESIRQLKQMDITYIDPSWGAPALTEEELASGTLILREKTKVSSTPDFYDLPPGHWVLLERYEPVIETYTSPKLTKTEWGQYYPWNVYTPLLLNEEYNVYERAATGCVPLALAQYMYYTHFAKGSPKSCIAEATPINNGRDFWFSGSSESIWDDMPLISKESGTRNAALLIGWLGRKLNTDYGIFASFTNPYNTEPVLKEIYGIDFPLKDMVTSDVIKALKKDYPVIAHSWDMKNIIDERAKGLLS